MKEGNNSCSFGNVQILIRACFASQDDIIDDVESFVAAAEILKERGAYKIYIMATHGLLSADAPRLIEESSIDEAGLGRLCIEISNDAFELISKLAKKYKHLY